VRRRRRRRRRRKRRKRLEWKEVDGGVILFHLRALKNRDLLTFCIAI
jgi:hypothetical protein